MAQHDRRPDQKVEAFSAPRSLLAEAAAKALELNMTKTGFYRYCLAMELGYSRAEAKEIAEHGAIRQLREKLEQEQAQAALNDKPSSKIASVAEGVLDDAVSAKPVVYRAPSRKRKAAARSEATSGRERGVHKE